MQIITDFRALHAIPELDRATSLTVSYLRKSLSQLKCRLSLPTRGGLCAFFDFGKPQTLAFRADIDALPIPEATGLPWTSRHPGVMHACGHDGHAAILLELARRIHKEPCLPHNILLIFQPAEETDGGARDICESGILQKLNVKKIFGLHLWPGLPKGQLFSRPGVLMSNACQIRAIFSGTSVHIAKAPKKGDALYACIQFYNRVTAIQRQFPFLLKFGKISGGTANNVICGQITLQGSLRTRSLPTQKEIQQSLERIGLQVARQTGCHAEIRFTPGYPAVCNHPVLWQTQQKKTPVSLLNEVFWTADDFSFYQQQVPGIYYLFGIGDTPPLHNPRFCFDEQLLSPAADFLHQICQSA